MPVVSMTVHPDGLHPIEAVKAWHKHTQEGMSVDQVIAEGDIVNLRGDVPGRKAMYAAIRRVEGMGKGDVLPKTRYQNCGRSKLLSDDEQKQVVAFVAQWRTKRFCTCRYIRQELKLAASTRTINRVLNDHGYYWRKVPAIQGLTVEQLKKRQAFVEKYKDRPAAWWVERMNLVLDGVTLTMPPRPLSGRLKHAAQRISSMWVREGERLNNDLHTHNRCGIQLGTKVPLWGGFTGNGKFTLRMWTPKPKMTRQDWEELVPSVKETIDDAYGADLPHRPWVWHDNERFLLCPSVYQQNGLTLHRFPPNSGDLNPIETVWAWLRKDLAKRELEDLKSKRTLTPPQFKQRCAQLLHSYSVPAPGETHNRYQKLLRGMPARLKKCKDNRYGRCGK